MKKIEAIIRKTKFEDVKEALLAADIEWFSYYDVRGEGKMRQARIYRGVMVILPEYGREIQQMVDHCLTLTDREERQRCAPEKSGRA